MTVKKNALFSRDMKHRYVLTRDWSESGEEYKKITYIGMNPSIADDTIDDPTIRRLISFTKSFGYNQFDIVNLVSVISTNPRAIDFKNLDISSHSESLYRIQNNNLIVACWGKPINIHFEKMANFVKQYYKYLWCFGINKDGSPKHPLYLKSNTKLIPYEVEP